MARPLLQGFSPAFFVKKGFKVLAIDADPSPNLALTLGIPLDQANKIVPISENAEFDSTK